MYKSYKPNEKIVDRAVEIWKRLLRNPKYDNLGKDMRDCTFEDAMPNLMASVLTAKLPSNATPEVLDKFGKALKRRLLTTDEKYGFYIASLHVDYDPDRTLRDAADEVGLKMQFPWKTNMHIHESCVAVGDGYAAPFVYHYPLSNNRWLMTTLYGTDIDKVIKLVEEGCNLFEVENDNKPDEKSN